MALGGARPGAGRKPGGKNKRTQEIALRAAESGITPIEVMIQAMQLTWKDALQAEDEGERRKLQKAAVEIAKEAAPYIHPKMATRPLIDDGQGGPALVDPDPDI